MDWAQGLSTFSKQTLMDKHRTKKKCMLIQLFLLGFQDCLCPPLDVHNPLSNSRDLTVISYFTPDRTHWSQGHSAGFSEHCFVKGPERKPSFWGYPEVTEYSQRAPAYGIPVAGLVIKVPKVLADVLRHVWEPSLLPHVLGQMPLTLESTSGVVSVLSHCWMVKGENMLVPPLPSLLKSRKCLCWHLNLFFVVSPSVLKWP